LAERDAAAQLKAVTMNSSDMALKLLRAFHVDPRYGGDRHRADLAWAIYSASRGFSEQQIKDEILHARVLSKKGRPSRQHDYADRPQGDHNRPSDALIITSRRRVLEALYLARR